MAYVGATPVDKATRNLYYGEFIDPTRVMGIPSGYTVNNIEVFINGYKLNPDEYTATDGLTIDLGVKFPAGTAYRVDEFRTFESANHYTKFEADGRFTQKTDADQTYVKVVDKNTFTEMPTVDGAPIVERGSNSDGEWTKWADGTMHCIGGVATSDVGDVIWVFPIAFVEVPAVTGTPNTGLTGILSMYFANNSSLQQVTFRGFDTAGYRAFSCTSLAIGRWK